MITFTLKLKNGETREVQAYGYGVLAVHKSIITCEKGLWQLTHKPTSGTLATSKTKKELAEIAQRLIEYVSLHLDVLKWTGDDPLEIFTGKDGKSHRQQIAKICGRA